MEGWIKINRDIAESWLWEDAVRLQWWMKLCYIAAWKPEKKLAQGQLVELSRGQAIVSVRYLQKLFAKKNKMGKILSTPSERTVLNFLAKLEEDGRISRQKRQHQITILTICDKDSYQVGKSENDNSNDNSNDNEYEEIKKYNNILTASKNFEDGDDFKSQILSQLQALQSRLDAQEKEKKPTTKKAASPLVARGREIFEKRYADLFGDSYYWQAKDAAAMGSLTKKITYSRNQKGMPTDDGEVLKALEAFLASITDEWLLKNFSVTNINSKYNEIVAQARAKMDYGKTDRQNLCDKRRSSEVTALTAKDYEGSF